jgi:hypothetical protein
MFVVGFGRLEPFGNGVLVVCSSVISLPCRGVPVTFSSFPMPKKLFWITPFGSGVVFAISLVSVQLYTYMLDKIKGIYL